MMNLGNVSMTIDFQKKLSYTLIAWSPSIDSNIRNGGMVCVTLSREDALHIIADVCLN